MKKILRGPSKYRAKCTCCDTEFEYQYEDIRYGRKYGEYVNCPTCGSVISHRDNPCSHTFTERGNMETMEL